MTNGPSIQLQPVLLRDYLDTTDILVRSGQSELRASPTGRWAERLSAGLTHALAAALVVRLPQEQIALAPPAESSARQILVDVEAFNVWPDGHCLLSASWVVLEKNSKTVLSNERGTFVLPPSLTSGIVGDAAVVAVMDVAIGRLADSIVISAEKMPQ